MSAKFPVVLFALIVGALLVVSFSMMTFRNSKDCSQLVIDTNEVASGINIPSLLEADCHFWEESQIRTGIYVIDTMRVDLENYIVNNQLSAVAQNAVPVLWIRDFLENEGVVRPQERDELYFSEGVNEGNRWQCILDKKTGRLWFEIQWL